jgi:hypothetical protein
MAAKVKWSNGSGCVNTAPLQQQRKQQSDFSPGSAGVGFGSQQGSWMEAAASSVSWV